MGDLSPPDYFLSFKKTLLYIPHFSIGRYFQVLKNGNHRSSRYSASCRTKGKRFHAFCVLNRPCEDSLSLAIASLKRKLGMRLSSWLSVWFHFSLCIQETCSSVLSRLPARLVHPIMMVFYLLWSRFCLLPCGGGAIFPINMALLQPTGRYYHPYPPPSLLCYHFISLFCSYLTLAPFIETITSTVKRSVCVQPRRKDAWILTVPLKGDMDSCHTHSLTWSPI